VSADSAAVATCRFRWPTTQVVDDAVGLDVWETHFRKHLLAAAPTGTAASKEIIRAVDGQAITPGECGRNCGRGWWWVTWEWI